MFVPAVRLSTVRQRAFPVTGALYGRMDLPVPSDYLFTVFADV